MSKKFTFSEKDYVEIYKLLRQTFNNPDDMVYLINDLLLGFCTWSDVYPKHAASLTQASNRIGELLISIERGEYDK
jgi:hypothetical protein